LSVPQQILSGNFGRGIDEDCSILPNVVRLDDDGYLGEFWLDRR